MKNIFILIIAMFFIANKEGHAQMVISSGYNWTDVELYKSEEPGRESRANTNYSKIGRICANAWTESGYPSFRRSLIHIKLDHIKPGTRISSAILHVFSDPAVSSNSAFNGNSQLSGHNAIFLEKVTQPWAENTVTWNNQPTTTPIGRIWVGPSSSTTENRTINITSLIQDMINNPASNHGFMMRLENEIYYRSRTYASEDHSNSSLHPKLVLTFDEPLSFNEESDFILAPLDKTQIPTRILYDRVTELNDLTSFNGTSNTDTTTTMHFLQAYNDLFRSNYNSNSMVKIEELQQRAVNIYNQGFLPIGIINYNYNLLDEKSLDDNLLQLKNGQLYDVINRSRSPYLLRRAIIISPIIPVGEKISAGMVNFKLDSDLFFSNSGLTVQYLDINFDDGQGVKRINPGGTIQINYSRGGIKNIHINIRYTNGVNYVAKAQIVVEGTSNGSQLLRTDILGAADSVWVTGYPFDVRPYFPNTWKPLQTADVKVCYLYGKGNEDTRVIKKPIIFLDGIDPLNNRNIKKIYSEYINDLDDKKNGINLGEKLRNEGYDIIIIDYKDGGDLIEKNGLAVIKALETIYETHKSTLQQNFIIIGPSMGALVAQYALAEAEKRGINHRTQLFISFDGPHQGANMPIGILQGAGYFFKNHNLPIPDFKNSFQNGPFYTLEDKFPSNVPAAKQLLLHHYQSKSESPAPHNFRNIFVSTMNTLGYPQNCRKVAIVNGSKTAKNQTGITPHQQILSFEVRNIITKNLRLRWIFYASAQSYRGKTLDAYTKKRLLSVGSMHGTYLAYSQPLNGNLSLDNIPGGYSSTMRELASIELKKLLSRSIKISAFSPHHSFISTPSAVDLRHPQGLKYVHNFGTENIVCQNLTPFNAVYAPLENEEHVIITTDNSLWFENEIKGTPSVSIHKTPAFISGPYQICGEATYTLNNFPQGAIFKWTKSDDLIGESNNTKSTYKVSSSSTTTNNSWVKVEIKDNCGLLYESKTFNNISKGVTGTIGGTYTVGWHTYTIRGSTGIGVDNSSPSIYFALNHPNDPNTSYQCETTYMSGFSNFSFSGNFASLELGSGAVRTIKCTVYSICGVSEISFNCYNTSSGGWYLYSYPNPADDEFTVNALIADSQDEETGITFTSSNNNGKRIAEIDAELELINDFQQIIWKGLMKAGKVKINSKNLSNGIYYLRVNDGKTVVVKRLIIKH
jgi:hypothetical protein